MRDIILIFISSTLRLLSFIVPKKVNLFLFGGFSGNHFGDNSAELFKYIYVNNPEFEIYWISHKKKIVEQIKAQGYPSLYRYSLKAIISSLRASFIFGSHSVKDATIHIPSPRIQNFIYLHHGIPLRKGWFDLKNPPKKALKSSKDKIRISSFMIAPSIFAAEQQNKLLPIGLKKFRIAGLPRNDIIFNITDQEKNEIINTYNLNSFNKIILYAPTWREWSTTIFFPFRDFNWEKLEHFLEKNNTCIILRPHHIDLHKKGKANFWDNAKKCKYIRIITHDKESNINVLFTISNVLITDYSSLYYDFLLTKKPVVFLNYDYKEYIKKIGLYVDYNKVAIGPKPKNLAEFISEMNKLFVDKDDYKTERESFANKFHNYFDGNSSERIVQELKYIINE